MRIVLPALHYHPDQPGGSARIAFDEARYLAARGHDVWLVTTAASAGRPQHVVEDGVHVLRYEVPRLRALDVRRRRVHQVRVEELLRRYVGPAVDCVHGHAILQYDGALSLYAGRARTCYSVHSPARLEILAAGLGASWHLRVQPAIAAALCHGLERRALARSDAITTFSAFTRSLLRRLHGDAHEPKVTIVPGWVDANRFRVAPDREAIKASLGWPLDRPVLFTLRRLVPRMGLDRLLEAGAMLQKQGHRFQLVIGGAGPLWTVLQNRARQLGIDGCVRFLGRVPDDALPRMYAAADVFVLPTRALECFGLIALEALACGRPVLATPVGAIPEVVGRVEPGWLASDTTAGSIAVLIGNYLQGRLRAHDPNWVRHAAVEQFSIERRLAELVEAAMGVGHRRPPDEGGRLPFESA